jgi:hypothetical protein
MTHSFGPGILMRMRSGVLVSCLLGVAAFNASCGGRDHPATSPSDASTSDASLDAEPDAQAGQPADAGPDGDVPARDAGFDRLETTGLQALDVPECLADLFIDPVELRQFVSDLSGANEVVIDGEAVRIHERFSSEGRDRARAYLRDRYLELGYEVEEHAFDDGFAAGANLIAERAGDDDAFLVVSAHLDAVEGVPGADDDASGLATVFGVAAALKDCGLTHTVRFIAFDEEELGAVGSSAYAAELVDDPELVLGMIQLEMTGYDSDKDGAFVLVHCSMPEGVVIADTVVAAVGTLELPLRHQLYCTSSSDHGPFWAHGFPAIAMGELFFSSESQGPADPNPCYHAACDTADALDYQYMANLTAATALAAATLAGAK